MPELILTLGEEDELELVIDAGDELELVMGESSATPIPTYDGAYEVTPSMQEQNLWTYGMRMIDDVTIHEIPVTWTTNEYGGKTVVIG